MSIVTYGIVAHTSVNFGPKMYFNKTPIDTIVVHLFEPSHFFILHARLISCKQLCMDDHLIFYYYYWGDPTAIDCWTDWNQSICMPIAWILKLIWKTTLNWVIIWFWKFLLRLVRWINFDNTNNNNVTGDYSDFFLFFFSLTWIDRVWGVFTTDSIVHVHWYRLMTFKTRRNFARMACINIRYRIYDTQYMCVYVVSVNPICSPAFEIRLKSISLKFMLSTLWKKILFRCCEKFSVV